jgi:hypothetical protein
MGNRIRITLAVFTAFAAMAFGFGVPAANAASRAVRSASTQATRIGVTPSPGKRAAAAARFKLATSPLPIRPVRPVPAGDEIVDGRGDSDGWHIYAASSGDGWSWRPLATLDPFGLDPGGERWIGRQCLTGDGKYVVAVVAPWSANNSPAGLDHGGVAYAVNARTGAVHPLVSGVSLYYFTPSCGPGSSVALTAFTARDESRTTLVLADAATASVRTVLTLRGQFADAAPAPGGGFFAVAGNAILHLAAGTRSVRARTRGRPFDLVANAAGGVDYLVGVRGVRASIWHLGRGRPVRAGGGVFDRLALFNGHGGHTIAAGTTGLNRTSGILALPRQPAQVEAVSLAGTAYSLAPMQSRGKIRATPGHDGALPDTPLVLSATRTEGARRISSWLPTIAAPPTASMPRVLGRAPWRTGMPARRASGGQAKAAAMFSSSCAVARNDVHLQAMQPSPQQVDWAANLAGRGLLTGNAARSAGYANLGLPGYSPSQDFPMPAPFGPNGDSIPREILEGVFAQESNFSQASWHSIQGVAGNPLIADYYGAGGGYVAGVTTPDCGYGIGQVTTGMQAGQMSYDLQRKVAVDYAENAAASAQILAQKWNELKAAGITANGNDPKELEDWYLALWDYNSGLHPNTGSGPWGLGWANNPANPDYPYNRGSFLYTDDGGGLFEVDYQDAAIPGNWPYQEKIFGWIAIPFRSPLTGVAAYVGTIQTFLSNNINVFQLNPYGLTSPGMDDFCDSSKNQCDSGICNRVSYGGNCDPLTLDGTGPCTRSDFECWWHYPDGFCSFFDVLCNTGSWEYNQGDAEPPAAGDSLPLPTCYVDPASVPAASDIVDSQASAVNLQGCTSSTMNWQNNGTFAFSYGDPAVPESQQTDMDVHQLGTGLGGHIWFTHTNEPTDAHGVSLWGVTGTWTPNIGQGRYNVKVYIPSAGASATQANYTVSSGLAGASRTVTINQNSYSDQWVSLGNFWLGPGSTVSLTNLHVTSGGDLAFSGMAFIPGAPAGTYAMLGDSYSSGEGTGLSTYFPDTNNYQTTQGTNNGHRSPDAANQVFAAASAPFSSSGAITDVACSGAIVADYYSTNPKGKCPNEPGQKNALSSSRSLVTFSFGGNDLEFKSLVTDCVKAGAAEHFTGVISPYKPCQQKDGSQFASDLTNLTSGSNPNGLPQLFAAIRAAAPNADIVVMGYPHLLMGATGGRCLADGWVLNSDQVWLNSVADQIDTAVQNAAAKVGFGYISSTATFTDHELCSADPWFTGILDPNANDNYTGFQAFLNNVSPTNMQQWFHPNISGYAAEAYLLQQSVQVPMNTQLSLPTS